VIASIKLSLRGRGGVSQSSKTPASHANGVLWLPPTTFSTARSLSLFRARHAYWQSAGRLSSRFCGSYLSSATGSRPEEETRSKEPLRMVAFANVEGHLDQ